MMNIRANYQIFAIRINPAMKILAILFLLFTEIPLELYSPKYTSETMDSVYNACLVEAESSYEQDMEQACCYLMADWAYGESMLDLSEYLIERALESRIEDMVAVTKDGIHNFTHSPTDLIEILKKKKKILK